MKYAENIEFETH